MQAKKAEIGTPPAIDFWRVNQVDETEDKYKETKHAYATISIPLSIDGNEVDSNNCYDRHVKIFKHGTAGEFCDHMYVCDEMYKKLGYDRYFNFFTRGWY